MKKQKVASPHNGGTKTSECLGLLLKKLLEEKLWPYKNDLLLE